MKIILQKEDFLNSIKAVRGIVPSRAAQPVLSSILIETSNEDKIKLTTTDLNLSMIYNTKAKIEKEGKIAISAKVLEDIVVKLPDNKEITIELTEENLIKIQSEKTKYEVKGMNFEEFPNVFSENKKLEENIVPKDFTIDCKNLNRSIKQTAFAAIQNETGGVLGGVCFTINENTLEMVATDGNRLTRARIPINSKNEELVFICAHRTLMEISKLLSLVPDKEVKFTIKGSKILFEFENIIFQSGLIEGTYPRYHQLIPTNNEKIAVIDREKLINTIDRISVMVNNRTNIMKFNFENSSLEISTDASETGSAKERMDINYESENLLIAFNYKYILDVLRNVTSDKIRIEMSTNLSATLLKPDEEVKEEGSYICLIMPVQVR